ncbi:chorismate mutase 2-like [Magnolia sinica]|uniref:chorismate mutase 2-like n=1 Tax=Magnolia sinica TaxID=86752 RepID=UPI002659C4C0|nr:chorismate mutase 2-like [Magnolia sinica]
MGHLAWAFGDAHEENSKTCVGRYENPECPFFPDDLPSPLAPPPDHTQVLYPKAASININKTIWNMYINKLLPLFTAEGDDGNYASTATCDLACLQAISRRIHYGMYVAEIKFRDCPQEYGPAVCAQNRDALMKMLTFENEEMVKRRVEKKAKVFGQEVSLDDKADKAKCF